VANHEIMEYRQYTTKSEWDKCVHTLEGILKGIGIDHKVNMDEFMELKNWCQLYIQYRNRTPFNEIIPLLENAMDDNELTKEEVDDILWVCKNISTGSIYYETITSDIQRLQGILHGILADNVITDEEVVRLREWLNDNKQLQTTYPYDEVYSFVESVLEDGKVDEDERRKLKVFFADFVDMRESYNLNIYEIEKLREGMNIAGICAKNVDIVVKGKGFCFTGGSSRMVRSQIAEILERTEGIFCDNVTKKTNYLVIGDEGNPCWAFACYGRKVEKVIQMRKEGNNIVIAHENDFWKVVEK